MKAMSGPGAMLSSSPEMMKSQRSWIPSIHIPFGSRHAKRPKQMKLRDERFHPFPGGPSDYDAVISLPPTTAYFKPVGIDQPTAYW
jgi:hypothetical protein